MDNPVNVCSDGLDLLNMLWYKKLLNLNIWFCKLNGACGLKERT